MANELATSNGSGDMRLISLNNFDASKYNTLMPMSVEQLSPLHSVRYFEVRLDPNPTGGDVYPESSKLALTKRALFTLADAAGVIWYPPGCKRMDRMDNPDYCAWQVQGGIRRPDGTVSWITASKEIDLRAIEDIAEQKRVRKHKAALCETKAYLRALRMLLHVKSTYTADELRKPFVVAQAYLDPAKMDDEAKRIWKIKVTQEINELFGPELPTAQPVPQLNTGTVVADDDENDGLAADGPLLPPAEPVRAEADLRESVASLARQVGFKPELWAHRYAKEYSEPFESATYENLVACEKRLADQLATKT